MSEKVIRSLRLALSKAIKNTDRDAIRDAAETIIGDIRASSKPLSQRIAEDLLSQLRSVREFELMQRVSDALIQSGQDSLRIRRQYAQSLLDQGNVTAGIGILKQLLRDSRRKDPAEHDEASGLLGRAYKQLYVDATGIRGGWVNNALRQSIKHYHLAYKNNPKNLWHGVNTVALMQRAERDGMRVVGYPKPKQLAADILTAVTKKRRPSLWDMATAAEACIGLEDYEGALRWTQRYTSQAAVTAFHLGSLERQLREVWGLAPDRPPGSRVLPIVRRELLRREGASVEFTGMEIAGARAYQDADEPHLEKILGRTGVQSYRWWLTGLERARAVARIGLEIDHGAGTGFLLRGTDLDERLGNGLFLMTNAHVISDDADVPALRPDEVVITFQALDEAHQEYEVDDVLFTSPPGALDATLVKLNQPVIGIKPYPLHTRLPTPNRARVYVIGHPQGGTLSFSLQDNLLIAHKAPKLHYRAPTEPGSSGSPVFNAQWRLIGLHHAGSQSLRRLDGPGTYAANEGIWIESIRKAIVASR